MTSYPNHQYRKMHLRKFDFLFVGHAESKYRSRPYFLCCWVDRKWSYDLNSVSLWPLANDDLSEVLKISGKQVKPWHQMNTHMRNSSIIFKNSCPRRISHHPKRCYLIVWTHPVLTSLVANKVSRRYRWVNAQTDKNLASGEYLNIESKCYWKTFICIFNVHLAAIVSLSKLAWPDPLI